MEKHQYKIIYSKEDAVYRIMDLTDTSIIGITKFLGDNDWLIKEIRKGGSNDLNIRGKLGERVADYDIVIFLDGYNMHVEKGKADYYMDVLRQMALFFKEQEIDTSPKKYKDYISPQVEMSGLESKKKKTKRKKKSKWLKGWRLALLIIGGVLLMGFFVCLIVFPDFREMVGSILIGPFAIIMLLAYADDLFARR